MIVVDRVEGDYAVLLVNGISIDFPYAALPEGTKEGDVLEILRTSDDSDDASERLKRLQQTTEQGPGDFEL